jgi:DNA-binding GntR family transcriptional regulator
MSRNPGYTGFLGSLISRTSLILAQHGRHEESDCSIDEHISVLAALRSRAPETAIAAIGAHLPHVLDRANLYEAPRRIRPLRDVLAQYS